jgi:hypothetical protein
MSMKIDHTAQEEFAAASDELVSAQVAFQRANRALKQFDRENPVRDADVLERSESLQILYEQALENLREKEEIQKFMHHELFAMNQQWGRGPEPWRR